MRPSVPDVHITDQEDAELAAYRALAGQSVLGLIFGLFLRWPGRSAALVHSRGGNLLSVWALRRIKKSDSLTGRKMALAGLMLSCCSPPRRRPTGWPIAGRSATRPGSSPPCGFDCSPTTNRRRPTN